jgi:GxxExxY protein
MADSAKGESRFPENVRETGWRTSCSIGGMELRDDTINRLTEQVIGCAIEVHRELGPGLLESVYRECLAMELDAHALGFESERHIPIDYKGQRVRGALKLDLLVEGCLVVELKTVEALHPVHLAQVMTYLKLTGHPAGLLMNFNVTSLRAGLRRLDHPDRYRKKQETRS